MALWKALDEGRLHPPLANSVGSLAILLAIRLPSSLVSTPAMLLSERLAVRVHDLEAAVQQLDFPLGGGNRRNVGD